MPLIVVHRHHDVIHTFVALHKDRVRRARAVNIESFGFHGFNRRAYGGYLFITKQAIFPGMRVDPSDRDSRICKTDTFEEGVRHADTVLMRS